MTFRLTVRWRSPGTRYHVEDVEATDLKGALEEAARRLPAEVVATADLAELRPTVDPEAREYTEG
jgi:hypothetical protein